MKVLKFGGTSVGNAQRIKTVAKLVCSRGKNIIVLSAMSGTTNTLVEISEYLKCGNVDGAKETLNELQHKYSRVFQELFEDCDVKYKEEAIAKVMESFNIIRNYAETAFSTAEKTILAQGEKISTALMYCYLKSQGVNVVMLDALDFMRINNNLEPELGFIRDRIKPLLSKNPDADLFLTQGYICRNSTGGIDNLQRGGSDLTASLIGAAINAEEVQIWTDIDGMHNNDPRFVNDTAPVRQLNFDEAAKLAHFGAKILHPTCILPAKEKNIPVFFEKESINMSVKLDILLRMLTK